MPNNVSAVDLLVSLSETLSPESVMEQINSGNTQALTAQLANIGNTINFNDESSFEGEFYC